MFPFTPASASPTRTSPVSCRRSAADSSPPSVALKFPPTRVPSSTNTVSRPPPVLIVALPSSTVRPSVSVVRSVEVNAKFPPTVVPAFSSASADASPVPSNV